MRERAEVAVTEECVPNIGERGRRRRIRNGIAGLLAALSVAAWAWIGGERSWWIWPLLGALYTYSALGFFQAKEKT